MLFTILVMFILNGELIVSRPDGRDLFGPGGSDAMEDDTMSVTMSNRVINLCKNEGRVFVEREP